MSAVYCCAALWNHVFFFFNDTATTEIYTLSLHDALPILQQVLAPAIDLEIRELGHGGQSSRRLDGVTQDDRSEEHTSELQSQSNLVCRLLLEKKRTARKTQTDILHADRRTSHTSSATSHR